MAHSRVPTTTLVGIDVCKMREENRGSLAEALLGRRRVWVVEVVELRGATVVAGQICCRRRCAALLTIERQTTLCQSSDHARWWYS